MKKFIPPTVEEVAQFIRENPKYQCVDPVAFVNFYASKGWMVGKNKMVCWHSAVSTWYCRKMKESGRLAPAVYPKPRPVQHCPKCNTRLDYGVCPTCTKKDLDENPPQNLNEAIKTRFRASTTQTEKELPDTDQTKNPSTNVGSVFSATKE